MIGSGGQDNSHDDMIGEQVVRSPRKKGRLWGLVSPRMHSSPPTL